MKTFLLNFLDQIKKELGEEINFEPPLSLYENIPSQLIPFYQLTNGLSFPFGEIYPSSFILPSSLKNILIDEKFYTIGFDGYFSYFLFHTDGYFVVWEHELDETPTVNRTNVMSFEGFLTKLYTDYLESDFLADIYLSKIDSSRKIDTYVCIRKNLSIGISDTVKLMEKFPCFYFLSKPSSEVIKFVRELHALNTEAYLKPIAIPNRATKELDLPKNIN